MLRVSEQEHYNQERIQTGDLLIDTQSMFFYLFAFS